MKIAIVNHKGGVGKTTISVHLAGSLAGMGYHTLVCDCDSQGDLSNVYVPRHKELPHSMADVFAGTSLPTRALIQATRFKKLSVIPADIRLNALDKTANYQHDPNARLLAEALTEVEQDFDYIIFDCPPRPHLTGFAALVAATHVVVPIEPSRFSVEGMTSLNWELETVRERLNPRLVLAGYVMSKVKQRASTQRAYRELLVKTLGREHLFSTMIPLMDGFDTALNLGKPVNVHAPRSQPAGVIRAFAKELIGVDNERNDIAKRTA